ncbi:hypothetical protein Q4E93_05575 [Flavitalea sp. BT771]|uniref:NHL domain-containing protein n=1 Tax=Flavitalea sp. BT771 TaxID=3063329 RepID=UPI0026E1DD73|nr:hypothetical protein [Flavitalea sp. BT771]MDO6430043.1 hypothetical protein [Flavitalea sp. BT771]MDV6219818.1 hypothetical protein [Flavitalea sp. BT771]
MKKLLIVMTAVAIGFAACKKSSAPTSDSDRKITLAADNNTPPTGANITFTVIASNNGPAASTGIVVSIMLPSGYTFVSAGATTGSYGAGAWSGFGLADGASATLTITATVNATGNYASTATIAGKENDPVAGNNSATVTITPTTPKGLMVSTLAGSDRGAVDGTGTAAKFSTPRGLAMDAAGNIYVADASNNRIRKITPAGVVSTLAGSTDGYAEGTGAAAKFGYPTNSVAVDASGNVYVADGGNNRVRKISPAGVVSTLAGDGGVSIFYQPLGVTVDAAGNVYVADSYNNRICKITPGGTVSTLAGSATGGAGSAGYTDGTGTAARFWTPNGVVIDASGNVYVTDASNYVIRKISPAGVVSTLAGSVEGFADGTGSAARFEHLAGPAIDAAGNIYVGDIGNNRVRKITPAGVVSTVAGGAPLGYADGPVATAQFSNPFAVTVDATGNLYVSDVDNNRIRRIGY